MHVMIADQDVARGVEAGAQGAEQGELFGARVLSVVADGLHEVRADGAIDLFHGPQCGTKIPLSIVGQVQVAGDDEDGWGACRPARRLLLRLQCSGAPLPTAARLDETGKAGGGFGRGQHPASRQRLETQAVQQIKAEGGCPSR